MNVYVVCVMHHMSLHAGNANKFNLEGKGQGAVYTFRLYIYIIMCVCVCVYTLGAPGMLTNCHYYCTLSTLNGLLITHAILYPS